MGRDIKGSRCMIASAIMASVLFMLSPGLTFLMICIIHPEIHVSEPGTIWILSSSILGIVNFIITIPYSLTCFSYNWIRTTKRLLYSVFMALLIGIQLLWLLEGTIKYSIWSIGSNSMHVCYLLVMIFGWVFSPIYWTVVITCVAVFRFRVNRYEAEKLINPNADPLLVPTCCCAPKPGEEDCCACCEPCCSGLHSDPNRTRFNNSCCCDGCCNCCIDCCVAFCGASNGNLPPGLQQNDIVYGPNGNPIVYQPVDPVTSSIIESIPTATIPMAIPIVQPVSEYTPSNYPLETVPMNANAVYMAPLISANPQYEYINQPVFMQPATTNLDARF